LSFFILFSGSNTTRLQILEIGSSPKSQEPCKKRIPLRNSGLFWEKYWNIEGIFMARIVRA
jgi:hypothetical protein